MLNIEPGLRIREKAEKLKKANILTQSIVNKYYFSLSYRNNGNLFLFDYYPVFSTGKYYWVQLNPQYCNNDDLTFEILLSKVTPEWQEKLLFHLDLFAND